MQSPRFSSGDAATTIGRPFDPLVLQASSGFVPVRFDELWRYRELLWFLVQSNIRVRYKQTVLGASWAIIQPLFSMVVFSIFFGRLAGISSEGVPYPAFALCGLVPWTYFANSLAQSSSSLHAYEGVISKVYFPRLIIPLSAVIGGLLDLLIAFVVLMAVLFGYGITPTWAILLLPLFVVLAAAAALSVGLWFAALSVEYRDVRYVIPFVVQAWLFLTPIVYPTQLVPDQWRFLYGLNPMTGVVDGFRWALLGQDHAPGIVLVASTIAVLILLIGGAFYFRRVERTFADVV